jgi:hypothetical protein
MMVARREFIKRAAALTAVPWSGAGCGIVGDGEDAYGTAVNSTWRHTEGVVAEGAPLLRELVRYATLAPSSHNTQCWRFRTAGKSISILPDFARRCPAVDPDDHHLFVSLGCASENLIQAARAMGLHGEARFESTDGAVHVALSPTPAHATPLFQAIPYRQSTRGEYDAKPLSTEELALLERAASSDRVRLIVLTERAAIEKVLESVVQGNTAQMKDRAFVEELKAWIRFSAADAVRLGDGLFSASSGNPTLPGWLGNLLFDLFFTPQSENDKYARHLRGSAGVAVFVAQAADKAHWVEVGRAYERFALQATALGIRNAFVNQPVEVASLRAPFANAVGAGAMRPDLVVRFGRGPTLPRSLRRPVPAVLA